MSEDKDNPAPEGATAETSMTVSITTEALIDTWVAQFLHDSPVSRATEAMNYFTLTAIPALKAALKG